MLLALAAFVTVAAIVAFVAWVDTAALGRAIGALTSRPLMTAAALGAFGGAFLLRAVAWARVLPGLAPGHAWAALHVALAGNHLLPLRLGEPLRIVSVVRRTRVGAPEATASTVTVRSADVLAVVGLAALFGGLGIVGSGGVLVVVGIVGGVAVAGVLWTMRLRAQDRARLPGPMVLAATVAAWFAEAVLVWIVANAAGIPLGYPDAVFVTAVSVTAQVVAIAPGGLGTYEAAAVAAYAALGHDPTTALAAALAAHALKTLYSFAVGGVALVRPAPPLLGRMRLPRRVPAVPRSAPISADAPIVVLFPAHDEEATVADVVARVPERVGTHPVVTIVVDDGSADATAARAADAGARVVAHGRNRGLGAAVRTGLEAAVACDPAAVAFMDADGEYAPEELDRVVEPILSRRADYVVGSRFAVESNRMLPHRRVGNRLLTSCLSWVARRCIGDGQSGYRALSARAAAEAEIVHDYNYAQVITLDLLAKGYRYEEVPISYRFRTEGRSFIRVGTYLSRVAPAVYREINATAR